MPRPIHFLVNGSPQSAMGIRARSLAAHLPAGVYAIAIDYRSRGKATSAVDFLRALVRHRPRLVYVFDMAASGVAAALAYKAFTGTPVVIDTGDAISALARSIQRGPLGVGLTVALEQASLRFADHLVVRGTNHQRLLAEQGITNTTIIQDGVDTEQFCLDLAGRERVRAELGINGDLLLGTLGSSTWNEGLQTCYGWEMLDVLDRLRDRPVHALMIGGGSGVERMQQRARDLGLSDRIHFLGYTPYDELPAYLSAMDVGLSKQTNDVVGQVRTTGKLPLYMACSRYVLATQVGEATHVLPKAMQIPFDGANDLAYPDRLTERIAALLDRPDVLRDGDDNRACAVSTFDYTVLGRRLDAVLQQFV